MFEEGCFSCGGPTAGKLYCSAECRAKDNEASPTSSQLQDGDALTSAASSRSRLSPPISSSPPFGAVPGLIAGTSSPSASSPNTSPSPWNVVNGSPPPNFLLPPAAYPSKYLPSVEPMKVPALQKAYSADGGERRDSTLKYARRPGQTNKTTSPLALYPVASSSQQKHRRTSSGTAGPSSSLGLSFRESFKTSMVAERNKRCSKPGCTTAHTPEKTDRPGPHKAESEAGGYMRSGGDEGLLLSPLLTQMRSPLIRETFCASDGLARSPSVQPPLPPPSTLRSPPLARRRSVPMHHASSSFSKNSSISPTQSTYTPDPHAVFDSSSEASVAEPSSPEQTDERGRGRSSQRSSDDTKGNGDSSSSRSSAWSSSRSRTRASSRDRSRRGSDRGRGSSPRRGRRGSKPEGASEDEGALGDREESRGRESRSRGRAPLSPHIPGRPDLRPTNDHHLPALESTPEHGHQELEEAVEDVPARTVRGRRPTGLAKPDPFTLLSGGEPARASNSSSRSRERERETTGETIRGSSSRSRDRESRREDRGREGRDGGRGRGRAGGADDLQSRFRDMNVAAS